MGTSGFSRRWVTASMAMGALGWLAFAQGSTAGCAQANVTSETDGSTSSSTTAASGGFGGSGGTGSGASMSSCAIDCNTISTPDCKQATCNESSGQCEIVDGPDGEPCDDGLFCTLDDACLAGQCVGPTPNDCGMNVGDCDVLTCDETSKMCGTTPVANGAPCTPNGDLCVEGAACNNGLCLGGTPKACFFEPVPDDCHVSECDAADGMCKPVPGNLGQPCVDLTDLCTLNKTCDMTGVCAGGTPKDCSYLTQNCDVGLCDTTSGMCTTMAVMNGQTCDDMNGCTTGETCTNQTCGGGTPVTNCSQVGDGCCPTTCNATNDLDCAIMPSCKDIKMASPQSPDGLYTIDPDGPGPITAFQVYCDMTTDGGGWTQCLSVQNTPAQDLNCTTDVGYFDPCVDFTMASWSGSEVMLQLLQNNAKVYSGWGTRTTNWTYELLTSTDPPTCSANGLNLQYNRATQHPNYVTLNDGTRLTISGKSSGQNGWGGSWGNGYIIVVQTIPSYADNNLVTVMTETNSGCYQNCNARAFVGMTGGHEVMYGPGGTVSTASNAALTAADAFIGEFKFFVR